MYCVGPKVVSHKISVESIEEVSSVLKRAPVIWDNIHANDYDLQRLFLGPYKVKGQIITCVSLWLSRRPNDCLFVFHSGSAH